MLDENTEKSTTPPIQKGELQSDKPKTQIELAREAGNTWTFEGKEYELYVVNKQGGIGGVPVIEDGEAVGYVSATFEWNEKDTLLDAMEYDTRDETYNGETKRKSNDATELNAQLFHDTVQSGEWIEINLGEKMPPQHLTRDEMLNTEEETQSSIVTTWLNSFVATHYIDKSVSKLKLLFQKTHTNIFIKAIIGNESNPAHVMIFEFLKPSIDTRREMRQRRQPVKTDENGKAIISYPSNVHFRMKQCAKHFVSVKGVSLLDIGKPFDITVDADKKTFLSNFNPIWQVFLADTLFGVFDHTGK